MLAKLKKLIARTSVAQVAVWLGYKDTNAVKKWLHRNEIPVSRRGRVKEMLSCHY